jgi:uncharacterized protein YndB with AHSA1/START domain
MESNSSTKDREITISRTLNAPVELVWEVWTKPEHIANWWGPNGFTNTISKMDVNPGGEWSLTMHGPDGTDYKNESILKKLYSTKRLFISMYHRPTLFQLLSLKRRANKHT